VRQSLCRLVKHHYLGNKSVDGPDIRQAAICSERTKILVGVSLVVRLVIILADGTCNGFSPPHGAN